MMDIKKEKYFNIWAKNYPEQKSEFMGPLGVTWEAFKKEIKILENPVKSILVWDIILDPKRDIFGRISAFYCVEKNMTIENLIELLIK